MNKSNFDLDLLKLRLGAFQGRVYTAFRSKPVIGRPKEYEKHTYLLPKPNT